MRRRRFVFCYTGFRFHFRKIPLKRGNNLLAMWANVAMMGLEYAGNFIGENMIGIVLVTHGKLADEFRDALVHVVGPQKQIATIDMGANDDMEQRREDIVEAVQQVEDGSGVIILTDMFGGTPSNLAISIMEPGRVEVLAGINLPMLIKLASVRADSDIKEAIEAAKVAGRKYINIASELLDG